MNHISIIAAALLNVAASAGAGESHAIEASTILSGVPLDFDGEAEPGAVAASTSARVAISQEGKMWCSTESKQWHPAPIEMRTFFRDVAFADGQFVAVGGSYLDMPGVIMTSRDGEHWIPRRCGSKMILHGVTYGKGLYIAVGDDGIIITSRDGVDWKSQKRVLKGTLSSVAYGDGRFVAVGDDGVALVSADGIHWDQHFTGTTHFLAKVKHSAGTFHAAGRQLQIQSTNGMIWNRSGVLTHRAAAEPATQTGAIGRTR